jgi:hypothetical protein
MNSPENRAAEVNDEMQIWCRRPSDFLDIPRHSRLSQLS